MKKLFLLDFKGLWKGLRYFYLGIVLFIVLSIFDAVLQNDVLNFITGVFFAFIFYGFSLALIIYHGVHYYRTLIGRQAALYHALPVSKTQLIWSKLLAFSAHNAIFTILAFVVPFGIYFISGHLGAFPGGDFVNLSAGTAPNEAEQALVDAQVREVIQKGLHELAEVTALQWIFLVLGLLLLIFFLEICSALFIQVILQVQADSRFQKMGAGGSVLTFFILMIFSIIYAVLYVIGVAKLIISEVFGVGYSLYQYVMFGLSVYFIYIFVLTVILYAFNLNSLKKHLSI